MRHEDGCGVQGIRSGLVLAIVAALALAVMLLGPTARASAAPQYDPIIFVHGVAGSATQYEEVAKLMVQNGYPADMIYAHEYGGGTFGVAGVLLGVQSTPLDNTLARVVADHPGHKVNVVAHSLGTTAVNIWLGNAFKGPARRAKVRRYVGVDGADNTNCVNWETSEDIKCMGIFADSNGTVGTENHNFNGTQSHVEASTSPESFAYQYRFFTGEDPQTTVLTPQDDITVSGRAVDFPENTGSAGTTMQVWEVDPKTGARLTPTPIYSQAITGSGITGGQFGPINLNGKKYYEFVSIRSGFPDWHTYLQPFLTSTRWFRFISEAAGGGAKILQNTNRSPNHAVLVVMRQKEFWSNRASAQNDVLRVSTASASRGDQPPVDVIRNPMGNDDNIALHLHDDEATPGVTTLADLPFFPGQPFQWGMDVYVPAGPNPDGDGTVTIQSLHRGDGDRPQVLNLPNRPSSSHFNVVNFNSYVWKSLRPAFATDPGPATGGAPFQVGFDASGTESDAGPVDEYRWDFDGDGTTDSVTAQPITSHTYATPGVYHPRLRVVSGVQEAITTAGMSTVTATVSTNTTAATTESPPPGGGVAGMVKKCKKGFKLKKIKKQGKPAKRKCLCKKGFKLKKIKKQGKPAKRKCVRVKKKRRR